LKPCINLPLFLFFAISCCGRIVEAQQGICSDASALQYRVALLGNPNSSPDWTEEKLLALKHAGFNTIQLNVAWLSRPHDEALNLRDVVALHDDEETSRVVQRRKELLRRNAMAKRYGFRTIFHFGSPYMWRNPDTGEVKPQSSEAFHANPPWFDTRTTKLVEFEVGLLRRFRAQFPDVDDILVYTYDQDAWQASEFGSSSLSRGVPLHLRLPPYIKALHQAWTNGRSGHTMWWEPWELSAGQVYKCIPLLPDKHFGMMLHSNIAEVQISMPVDVWFRNTARMCNARGIPVVAEAFLGSATEEIQPLSFAFPRLTDEQLLTISDVEGVAGIKEYFGVVPRGDLNLEVFTARLNHPTSSTKDLIRLATEQFGPAQDSVIRMAEEFSDAMQFFPWDCSWYARLAGTANIHHGWDAADIRGQQVETPSWESTRRAHFMKTDDRRSHPFLLEDVQLRCEVAATHLEAGISAGTEAIERISKPDQKQWLRKAITDATVFLKVTRSYALHLRETNVAMLMRGDLEAGRAVSPALVDEMKQLLARDVKNQDSDSEVIEMQKQFASDPGKFVTEHLLPKEKDERSRGIFTLTTR
jgi:hypothetical protein